MNTYEAGLFAEWVAGLYLRLRGFRILEKRYVTGRRTGRAEIDIIAQKDDLIVFAEVKNRPTAIMGLDAVTVAQRKRLRRAAETYLRRIRWTGKARFDAIIVRGFRVTWVKSAI